jgi:hypothetical protein
MAEQDQQVSPLYNQIYTLRVEGGIKRDGTKYDAREYSDGVWCRFQRLLPKKIGGYREMFGTFSGIPRGMILNASGGVNYIFTGNENGIDVFTTGTSLGLGDGPFQAIIHPGYDRVTPTTNTTTQFTVTSTATPIIDYTKAFPTGTKIIFSQAVGSSVYTVSSSSFTTPTTTVVFSPALPTGTVLTNVYVANLNFAADPRNLWQWDMQYSPNGGALKVIGHPGLNLNNIDNGQKTQVLLGNLVSDSNQNWNFYGLADSGGQYPTFQPISVSGGVCVLYPYLFVYGSDGFIANNHVSSTYSQQVIDDWNGATANQVNMAAGKIVKAFPTRGGTNSPSGLFWATDSLIRVSFIGAAPLYWRYDIVSSQTSIMSSSAVVEMDGAFFWMGVDRFYVYNGNVSVLPNDKNVNWLFDNLNYTQRQKVWATKVPRYNEIWFFYPRGQATECTDAIIYNVKDKIWYDAGSADGAQRSCGYTTEVFPTPVWASWNYNVQYSRPFPVIAAPNGQPTPAANQFYLSGDTTSAISPGDYVQLSNVAGDPTYLVLSCSFVVNVTTGTPGGTLVTVKGLGATPLIGVNVYYVIGGYGIYQHEYGYNNVSLTGQTAITSSFTTCDISWVGGTPADDTPMGVNRRMHLRRIEPDFVQAGNLGLTIIGRKFAKGDEELSGPFYFTPDTGKIDLRVEYREVSFKFESNELNGNYEMGRIMITAEYGDERP